MSNEPSSAVAVCVAASLLVHVTVLPRWMVTDTGENAKPLMFTAVSVAGGGGGGGGGGGEAQLIGPSGMGLFKCSVAAPAGGGGAAADPAARAKLQALAAPLQKLWGLPNVPSDLIDAQRLRWSQLGGASEGGGGGSRADWRRALTRVELDTPADSWQLEMIPSLLSSDGGTLKSIVNKIKNGTRRPSPQVAARLEAITGIPLRTLLLNVEMGPGMAMQTGA